MNWRFGLMLAAGLLTVVAGWKFLNQSMAEPPVVRATVVHRPVLLPRLQVDETRHNFGTMDVEETGEHTFLLHNVGEGDLELRLDKTTCECTVGELANTKVPPGGQTQVRLRWQPPKTAELFAQGATLVTNDPQIPSLYLHVVGAVRKLFGVSRDGLLLNTAVGEAAEQSVVVYSQAWDDFTIQSQCDLAAIDLVVTPANEKDLRTLNARSGYEVMARLRPELPRGSFKAMLKIEVASPPSDQSPAQVRKLEVPIHGHISGRVSVQGAGLEEGNRLTLGTIWRGQLKKASLAILIRGEHSDLGVPEIRTTPSFVNVRVGGREQIAASLFRYTLDVEVAGDAPITHCVGPSAGKIVLKTNHPDAPELRLAIDFAVLEKP